MPALTIRVKFMYTFSEMRIHTNENTAGPKNFPHVLDMYGYHTPTNTTIQ